MPWRASRPRDRGAGEIELRETSDADARAGRAEPPASPGREPSRRSVRWPAALTRPGPGPSAAAGRGGDRVAAFRPPLLAIRWGTIAVGLAVAASSLDDLDARIVVGAVVLIAYAALRTVRPLTFRDDTPSLLRVLFEVALHVLVVVATGYWESPYVFSLITAIIVAGFGSGFAFAIRISLASSLAVALPWHATTTSDTGDAFRLTAQWTVELLLVAAVAGYARRLSGEAAERQALALDRLGRLAEANTLLYSLHQVAQALPSSLDLDEVLESTLARVRALFDLTSTAILLPDETSEAWLVARQEGARLPAVVDAGALPAPVRRTAAGGAPLGVSDLRAAGGPGLTSRARSGMYAPMYARGTLIGVVAVEHEEPEHYGQRDLDLLKGFVEPVALAVDNARWFGRLRTVGADEERTRIARDLHDRVGQSLAYLAFELDRIIRRVDQDDVRVELDRLRQDLRTVISEVRETLYDLRTDVSDSQDLVTTLEHFLERVRSRSELDATGAYAAEHRLPLPQEREMWRIAQEAVTNAERHADARAIRVRWRCDAGGAELEVADDGKGFERGTAGRLDSYGILGMRERAASIGATLDIASAPGEGTRVRCRLTPSDRTPS